MPTFAPPLSFRLNGGLRPGAPAEPLAQLLGVEFATKDDYDRGGAYSAYAPQPSPDRGLIGVIVHSNAVPRGLTDPTRPDLDQIVSIDWYGENLLDLGRLDWRLHAGLGDLFDVTAYSIVTLTPRGEPYRTPQSHWVEFIATPGGRSQPEADAPPLACRLEFELPEACEAAARAVVTDLSDSSAVLRSLTAAHADARRRRLTLQFNSPSLLDLGRYAEAIAVATRNAARVTGYAVRGDLQRDGRSAEVSQVFASKAAAKPAWRGAAQTRPAS